MVRELSKAGLYDFVWRLAARLGIHAPIDAHALIRAHCKRPHIEYMTFNSSQICGILYARERTTTIALNARHSPERQNFYALHEFIHYVMHCPDDRTIFCSESASRDSALEWQANEAAAELLVPMRRLLAEYKSMWEHSGRGGAGPDMNLYIASAASLFGVTQSVIRNRFDSLGYEIEQHINGKSLDEIEIISARQQASSGIRAMNPIERMDQKYYNYWRFRGGREARLVMEKLRDASADNPYARFYRYDWFRA